MKPKIHEYKLKTIRAMSKRIILLAAILMSAVGSGAQITLEYVNDTLAFGYFYCTEIARGESKYVSMDINTNSFSLYNMDMSPYLLNIQIPGGTDSLKDGFAVIYISRTLFDCDSNNIEYAYEHPFNRARFRIFRTDGTVLLTVDSARGPFLFGGSTAGTFEIRPIKNTSAGTKLFLDKLNPSGTGILIYSLCDSLIADYLTLNQPPAFLKAFPNPAGNQIYFEYQLPSNLEGFEIVLFNNEGKEMRRESIDTSRNKYTLDVSSLASGSYIYALVSQTKTFQSGKFILAK